MLDGLFGDSAEEEEPSDTDSRKIQRAAVRDILEESPEEAADLMANDDVSIFCLKVSAEQVEKLRELEHFDGRHETNKAIQFAMRHSDKTDIHVRVIDTENQFTVEVALVEVVGRITNDIVGDFAETLRRGRAVTFDPMAENHKRPVLQMNPW